MWVGYRSPRQEFWREDGDFRVMILFCSDFVDDFVVGAYLLICSLRQEFWREDDVSQRIMLRSQIELRYVHVGC